MCVQNHQKLKETHSTLYTNYRTKNKHGPPEFPTVYIIFENELDSDILNCN